MSILFINFKRLYMLHEGCNTYNMIVKFFFFAFFLFGFPHFVKLFWNTIFSDGFINFVLTHIFNVFYYLVEVILPYQWAVKMFCLVVKTFMCRPDSNLHAMHIQFWSIPLSLIIIFIASSRGRAITLHGFKTLMNINSWSTVR